MSDEMKLTFGDTDLTPMKANTFTYTVSHEMALDMGMIEPTPEELAERNERGRIFHAEQRELRAKMLAALERLYVTDDLTTAILWLHRGGSAAAWGATCDGCDVNGYGAEQPEWPCRTVQALAEYHDIELGDRSLPGAHYEGEFVPSDGKVFQPPPLRSFRTAFEENL